MTKHALVLVGFLAACGHTPHDVRVEVDGIPDTATNIVVSLALGNDVAPDLVYPIANYNSTETLVLSLPNRAGWLTATITAQDGNACDLAIGAGGIGNDFSGKVDDVAIALFPATTHTCGLVHTPGMVSFDANTFTLGCTMATDAACTTDETPTQSAQLGAFELDATEVTVGAYRDCVDAGTCAAPQLYSAFTQGDDAAQNGLTWDDADQFCAWAGKALPTEAQWEAAMRGTEGRLYPWGATAPDCTFANFAVATASGCVNLDADELDERRYVPGLTPEGLADAAGNVAEWVSDFYAPRSSLEGTTILTGPPTGSQHVTKGGSFVDFAPNLRGAARFAYDPDGTGPNAPTIPAAINLGVRCAYTR